MKVAICLSGHLRGFQFKNILNSISGVDYGVFISTWDVIGLSLGIYNNYSQEKIDVKNLISDIKNLKYFETEEYKEIDQDLLKLSYRYKNIPADLSQPLAYDSNREDLRKYAINSMFRKLWLSVKEVTEDYDIIIRTRPDCTWNINRILSQLSSINNIIVPSNYSFGGESTPGGGRICDSLAIGPYPSMKIYANIFNWLNEEETNSFLQKNDIWYCPHSLLRQYLILNKIPYSLENLEYAILSETGEKRHQ